MLTKKKAALSISCHKIGCFNIFFYFRLHYSTVKGQKLKKKIFLHDKMFSYRLSNYQFNLIPKDMWKSLKTKYYACRISSWQSFCQLNYILIKIKMYSLHENNNNRFFKNLLFKTLASKVEVKICINQTSLSNIAALKAILVNQNNGLD